MGKENSFVKEKRKISKKVHAVFVMVKRCFSVYV